MDERTVPLVINGQYCQTEKRFDVVSPLTSQTIHQCCSASLADVDKAVRGAADAFTTWRWTTPQVRRDIFLRAATIMESRREELVKYMKEETGAAGPWAHLNISIAVDIIKDVAGRIVALEGSFPATQDAATSSIVMREPYGVALAIAPWNAPCILGTRSVAFPMAAGNAVVFKASELSPRTHWAIVSVFEEAGLPAGVLNLIFHEPAAAASTTSALISNPIIKKINFTGSTLVGRIIAKLAGEHLKPLVLELGGKAPAIIWEDADLDLAANECARGSFFHAGQICMATERLIVHRNVRERFVQLLRSTTRDMFPLDKEENGLRHISKRGVEKNLKLVNDAKSQGALIEHNDSEKLDSPFTMAPVMLGNVTKEMDIYYTESFGPTVSIFEIETEEDALRIANDTEYGLSAAVFTEDLRRGLRLAKGIESGAVHINSMTIHDESGLPHGGAKSSGYGRFNAAEGLREWVRTKTVTFKN